jgi:hypothetical protein
MAEVDLDDQEAEVKTCTGHRNDDNRDAVVAVDGNSQEHEEQAKLEAQDARNIAVDSY